MTQGAARSGQSISLRRFVYHLFRRETVVRAAKVAGVVGPILTLINQYDVLLNLDLSLRLVAKIGLTFLVPYSVSSFSSARAYMDNEMATEPAVGANVESTKKNGDSRK